MERTVQAAECHNMSSTSSTRRGRAAEPARCRAQGRTSPRSTTGKQRIYKYKYWAHIKTHSQTMTYPSTPKHKIARRRKLPAHITRKYAKEKIASPTAHQQNAEHAGRRAAWPMTAAPQPRGARLHQQRPTPRTSRRRSAERTNI